MNIQDKRNKRARETVKILNKDHGMRWGFIASQIDMGYHSFANWRRGEYQFGVNRLDKVEKLYSKYSNLK